MPIKQKRIRNANGLAVTTLMCIIGVFIMGPLSMFVYELTQFNLAKQELKACVDLAALTAACSTTSSNSTDPATTQKLAMDQAAYMFAQNTILNVPLSTTPAYSYGTGQPTWSPVINQSQLYFQFLDPVTKTPVSYGSPNGKIMRVFGSFGFSPVFAKFSKLAVGPYLAVESSDGGLPLIDVVLCFDISGSMDDFTQISLVNRYSNGPSGLPAGNDNGYAILPGTSGTTKGQGPLYIATGATNATGSALNATYPMDIDNGGGSSSYGPYSFNATGHGAHTGSPPPQTKAQVESNTFNFTDCVVNIDGTDKETAGITVNGFTFPADDAVTHKGLGVLVEASRGNLESVATANAAKVPYSTWGITPGPGWFQAYYQAAMSAQVGFPTMNRNVVPLRHPIGDAILAAQSFFGVLSNDADVHFGLVTFSSVAGDSSSSFAGTQPYNISGINKSYASESSNPFTTTNSYPPEPVKCVNPGIRLNKTPGPSYSNYSGATPPPTDSVNGALFTTAGGPLPYGINTVVAEGGTNIQDALARALAMHLGSKATDAATTPSPTNYPGLGATLGRKGATRAIVLFTDGLPTAGGDTQASYPNSQNVARAAKTAGIPIYTIGLCLTPSLQAAQTAVLTDQAATGIANLSGNGATFNQTTDPAKLNGIFQNVARQLVQLVR